MTVTLTSFTDHSLRAVDDQIMWNTATTGVNRRIPIPFARRNGVLQFAGRTTVQNRKFTITVPQGLVWLKQMDNAGNGDWNGNFLPPQNLLYTNDLVSLQPQGGWLTLNFNESIRGVGTQFQPQLSNNFADLATVVGRAFQPFIDLVKSNGEFATAGLPAGQSGQSSNAADDSAVFLGAFSNAKNIRQVDLYVRDAANMQFDFAINMLDIYW